MQRQSFTLMVQGTTSDAGKSTLVAGLCRLLAKSNKKIAPFKPQNMALNSAVTQNGGEIGRAQALQAVACGLEPHTDMNPVLIKPSSDTNAQIIVHGHALENMQASTFHDYKPRAMQAVLDSYSRLVKQYDVIVVEGAGSPAEINLRQGDIANMGFAEAVDCPVIIVADIDRGGVFAHLVGTLELLDASEKDRVIGFVINRFRGDITLLQSGLDWLEQRTCKPVLGVIPYIHNLYLDAEDAIDTQQHSDESANALNVIVPVLPRISNHTDFDALRMHPKVNLTFVPSDQPPTASDLIIIPGTKNVRDDWAWLCQHGWDTALKRHLRYGGKLIGICGGYQMLGEYIHDPDGVEGIKGTSQGIGLIPMETTLHKSKKLERVRAGLTLDCKKVPVDGYEIHCGKSILSQGSGKNAPISYSKGEDYCREGYINTDNTILGTYLHGLFDHPQACQLLLQWAGLVDSPEVDDLNTVRQRQIDRLADTLEEHIDFDTFEIALEGFYRRKKSKV